MPCYDHEAAMDRVTHSKMAAVLCQLVKTLGCENIINTVDWEEAGVDPDDFRIWWEDHVKRDAERKLREQRG
jgi:hypothetical protein